MSVLRVRFNNKYINDVTKVLRKLEVDFREGTSVLPPGIRNWCIAPENFRNLTLKHAIFSVFWGFQIRYLLTLCAFINFVCLLTYLLTYFGSLVLTTVLLMNNWF